MADITNLTRQADAARRYAAAGYAVFPLHAPVAGGCSCGRPRCEKPGKHPRTSRGFLDASSDPAQVAAWWTQWPTANLGGVPATFGLVAVDVDSPEADAAVREVGLPDTVTTHTANGRHLWYRVPEDADDVDGWYGPLLLRHRSGFVVLPPSVHASGHVYRWQGMLCEAAELRPGLYARLQAIKAPARGAAIAGHIGPIPEGQRNATLFSIGCAMRRRGCGERAIRLALEVENAERCAPPMDTHELDAIVRSALRYEPSGPAAEPDAPMAANDGLVLPPRRKRAPVFS
jgi:hypothetical protein